MGIFLFDAGAEGAGRADDDFIGALAANGVDDVFGQAIEVSGRGCGHRPCGAFSDEEVVLSVIDSVEVLRFGLVSIGDRNAVLGGADFMNAGEGRKKAVKNL